MAMKQIRLEIPIKWGEDKNVLLPAHVWLRVIENHTEAFKDEKFTEPLLQTKENLSMKVEVPNELTTIKVIPPRPLLPITYDIYTTWAVKRNDSAWRIAGLNKIFVIFDNLNHEVQVINERPDVEGWKDYIDNAEESAWLFLKKWALVVYLKESECVGELYVKNKTRREIRQFGV